MQKTVDKTVKFFLHKPRKILGLEIKPCLAVGFGLEKHEKAVKCSFLGKSSNSPYPFMQFSMKV